MTQVSNNFEAMASGTTIAITDPGDPDAFDNVGIAGGGILIYDSTRSATGTRSGKYSTSGTAGQTYTRWDTKFGTVPVTDHYWRMYMYLTGLPSAAFVLVVDLATSAICCGVTLQTDAKLRTFDNAIVTIQTFTNACALGQWIRIEGHFVHSTTVGQVEVKLFNTATSDTPTEVQTSTATFNTLASADRFKVGIGTALANIGPLWIDSIAAGYPAYPGQYVPVTSSLGKNLLLMGVG